MENNTNSNKAKSQHKLFKFIILIIVGVFFYLIYSFIRIEISDNNNFGFKEHLTEYSFIEYFDSLFKYTDDGNQIGACNLQDFYQDHIRDSKLCIIKSKSIEKYITNLKFQLNHLEAYLNRKNDTNNLILTEDLSILEPFEYLELEKTVINRQNESTQASLNNKDKLFIQLTGESSFGIVPISEINNLKAYRTIINMTSKTYFNTIFIEEDLFDPSSITKINKLFTVKLDTGDALYIPAYFFVQTKLTENQVFEQLNFIFASNSRILDSVFKTLFDYLPNPNN